LVLSYTNKNFNSTGSTVASGDSIYYYYYAVSGINNLSAENGNSVVYPNPSTGVFNISIKNYAPQIGGTNVEIYNVLGEKVYSQFLTFSPQLSIDLTGQPSGFYFYRILDENKNVISNGKLIIKK